MSEVIVGGGGPAGLAAAIAAAQAGLQVTLFDGARPPIDKACGEGIMPDGLAALLRLGVTIPVEHAFPFRGIRFLDDSHNVGASFPYGEGYGIRRVILHELLVRRAASLGVDLRWGERVTGLNSEGVEVGGKTVPYRWLVCADGQNSLLRNRSGRFPSRPAKVRYGFRRHYRMAPWTNYVEVHWADPGQMYVTPVANDEVCVALITSNPELRFDAALPHFSQLAARLSEADIRGRMMGAITSSRRLSNVISGNIALLGEAAGSVDAITGEGLSIAFQQSLELASAMKANRLEDYEWAHRRIMRVPRGMSRLLLAMDKRHTFRSRALGALERQDDAFHRLLAIHLGTKPVREFGLGPVMRLGWDLLHA